MGNRREFIYRLTRWGIMALLAGITILISKKLVVRRDCYSCPEYAGCPGTDSCTQT